LLFIKQRYPRVTVGECSLYNQANTTLSISMDTNRRQANTKISGSWWALC